MALDKFQQAWQSAAAHKQVSIQSELLLHQVQQRHKSFKRTIFWRDFREVGAAAFLALLWIYLGIQMNLPWTWFLMLPSLVWGAAFILVDRWRHPDKAVEPNATLLQSIQQSADQVEHQIWLLRNVLWWYLLPYALPLMAFFLHICWRSSSSWWTFGLAALCFGMFLFGVYAWLYHLNQQAIHTELEPRRQELSTLISSLADETEH